jgi:hypothetical protein
MNNIIRYINECEIKTETITEGFLYNELTLMQQLVIAECEHIIQEYSKSIKNYERNIFGTMGCKLFQNSYQIRPFKKKDEKELELYIIDNFNTFFPEYDFVKNQYKVKQGTIDIYAKDKITNKDVIIELKYPKGKINRQLLDYNTCYDDEPILVAVNARDEVNLDNIIYINIDFPENYIEDYNHNSVSDWDKYKIAIELDKMYENIFSFLFSGGHNDLKYYRKLLSTEYVQAVLTTLHFNHKDIMDNNKFFFNNFMMNCRSWQTDWKQVSLNQNTDDKNYDDFIKMTYEDYIEDITDYIITPFIVKEVEDIKIRCPENRDSLTINNFNNLFLNVSLDCFVKLTEKDKRNTEIGWYEMYLNLTNSDKKVKCTLYDEDNIEYPFAKEMLYEVAKNELTGHYTDMYVLDKYIYKSDFINREYTLEEVFDLIADMPI